MEAQKYISLVSGKENWADSASSFDPEAEFSNAPGPASLEDLPEGPPASLRPRPRSRRSPPRKAPAGSAPAHPRPRPPRPAPAVLGPPQLKDSLRVSERQRSALWLEAGAGEDAGAAGSNWAQEGAYWGSDRAASAAASAAERSNLQSCNFVART